MLTINLFNGLVYGALLIVMCSGLALIYGLRRVVNFAHGSLYMLGAYLAFQISAKIGFWPALVAAPLLVGAIGMLVDGAMRLVERLVPPPTAAETEQALVVGAEREIRLGWTGVQIAGHSFDESEVVRRLVAQGKIRLRIYDAVSGPGASPRCNGQTLLPSNCCFFVIACQPMSSKMEGTMSMSWTMPRTRLPAGTCPGQW